MSDIVFKPIVSLGIMIVFTIIMMIIVLFNRKNIVNRVLILLLMLIISQRPMIKDQEDDVYSKNLDVIFVVDTTASMNAVDVNNDTRINAVKRDCKKIIDEYLGSNFSIITYDNIAQVKYPLSDDTGTIMDIFDKMKVIEPLYAHGSTLDLAYDYLKMLLESSKAKEDRKRVVFFIGDGELSSEEAKETKISKYNDIADLIDSGAVLGYGTSEGAKILVDDYEKYTHSTEIRRFFDNNGYLLDGDTNKNAISRLNENNLKALAGSLKVNYYHVTDFSKIADNLKSIEEEAHKDDDKEKMDKDIYYYFSGVLLLLMLIELYYCRRNEQ